VTRPKPFWGGSLLLRRSPGGLRLPPLRRAPPLATLPDAGGVDAHAPTRRGAPVAASVCREWPVRRRGSASSSDPAIAKQARSTRGSQPSCECSAWMPARAKQQPWRCRRDGRAQGRSGPVDAGAVGVTVVACAAAGAESAGGAGGRTCLVRSVVNGRGLRFRDAPLWRGRFLVTVTLAEARPPRVNDNQGLHPLRARTLPDSRVTLAADPRLSVSRR